jgi:hypothetical protein
MLTPAFKQENGASRQGKLQLSEYSFGFQTIQEMEENYKLPKWFPIAVVVGIPAIAGIDSIVNLLFAILSP